jgi:hypothetical protein
MKSHLAVLLFTWLLAAVTWAQPVPSGVTWVDSREECAALGGAWLASRGNWQAACQVPWGREDCLRLRGAWTPMAAAPLSGVCIAQVSQLATARQCTDAGGTWGPKRSSMPYCEPGTAVARPPIKAASDANKVCGGQAQCVYGCVYLGPTAATGSEVVGHCRPTSQIEGCYSMVENGRLAGTICKN